MATKIDFTKLNIGKNVFTIKLGSNDFPGGILLDETVTEIVVTVNVSNVVSKKFNVSPDNIKLENLPNGISADFSEFQFSEVTVIGPQENVSALTDENLVLIADFGGYDEIETDSLVVPIKVSDGYCWSFGEYYAKYNIS